MGRAMAPLSDLAEHDRRDAAHTAVIALDVGGTKVMVE
jgi:hypothetical protein